MEKKNPKFSIPDRYTTIRASPEIVKWLWERGARLQARYAHRVSMDLVLRDIRDEIEGNT